MNRGCSILRKVLYITTASECKTGGERINLEIVSYLERQGVKVIRLSIFEATSWRFRRDYVFYNLWMIRYLWKHWSDLKGTVVLTVSSLHRHLFLFGWLARAVGLKLLVIVHHLDYHYLEVKYERHPVLRSLVVFLDKWLQSVFYWSVETCVVISESTFREVANLGVAADRIRIVRPGFDAALVELKRERCGGKVRILFVGYCSRIKGIEYLLEALLLLPREDIRLDIVGDLNDDPSYVASLWEFVRIHELEEVVHFSGHLPWQELVAYYGEADILVLPSLWEGYGIVLVEAMSAGLPIVATKVGSIPELVQDGLNGFLVPPKDPGSLARAISRLLYDPILRDRLGRNGRAIAAQHRSWEEMAREAYWVIQEILEK